MNKADWIKNKPFVEWLLETGYARLDEKGTIEPSTSLGVILYMHEAWLAGLAHDERD